MFYCTSIRGSVARSRIQNVLYLSANSFQVVIFPILERNFKVENGIVLHCVAILGFTMSLAAFYPTLVPSLSCWIP